MILLWPSHGPSSSSALANAYTHQQVTPTTSDQGFSSQIREFRRPAAPVPVQSSLPGTYTVLPGDIGLSVIAQKLYGKAADWPVLYFANGNTTIITAGEVLKVPPLPAVIPVIPAPSPSPSATSSPGPGQPTGPTTTSPPPASPSPSPSPASGFGIWSCIVQYEASPPGNWATDTGNGYYGGLQFTQGTWLSYGGGAFAQYADDASPADQVTVANRVAYTGWNGNAPQGLGAWPVSSVKCGA